MVDMTQFIVAKSDQLTADDLMGGPKVLVIRKVSANPDSAEQPISMFYEGDDGKPYKPCKTMRRIMVAVWGPNASKYVGRALRVYRDDRVQFGGLQVGGIRISHMSHMSEGQTVAVMVTRGRKAPWNVQPMDIPSARQPAHNPETGEVGPAPRPRTATVWLADLEAELGACELVADVDTIRSREDEAFARLLGGSPAQAKIGERALAAVNAARERLAEGAVA
jgi:hypothetical protein